MRRAIAATAAVAMVVGMTGLAGADVPKFRSTVHMHGLGPDPEYNQWIGDVHSPKRKCERRREVIVIYEEGPAPDQVGSDLTNRFGEWEIPQQLLGTDDPYYAKVKPKAIGHGEDRIVCKPDVSPDFAGYYTP